MDKAREETDKKLQAIEQKIGRVYENSSALKRVLKEYRDYMDMVSDHTESLFSEFCGAKDEFTKQELKAAYSRELMGLTLGSADYRRLVKKIARVLSQVNQDALDVVNREMADIYAINYNQVAEDCEKVGIEVDG